VEFPINTSKIYISTKKVRQLFYNKKIGVSGKTMEKKRVKTRKEIRKNKKIRQMKTK